MTDDAPHDLPPGSSHRRCRQRIDGRHCRGRGGPLQGTVRDWAVYNGGPEAIKYSALDQINRGNVQKLAVAWSYRTGDMHPAAPDSPGLIAQQANPIVVGDTLYSLGQNNKVFAVDAATGKPRWVHRSTEQGMPTRRGVVYWESPDRKDRRILFTIGPQLIALDAATGTPIPLVRQERQGGDCTWTAIPRTGSGRRRRASCSRTCWSMGSVVGEGYRTPPGNIRAYDVRTGALRWVFRTVPHPGEFGHETWAPESWKHNGGANVWGSFSLDVKRGMRLRPDRLAHLQLLRRRPPRAEPVRQLRAGAGRPHRQAAVALPGRPPRPVGLRSDGPAGAGQHPPQGQEAWTWWCR